MDNMRRKAALLTESADKECKELFILHKVKDVEAVLDLAGNADKRNSRYNIRHGRKIQLLQLKGRFFS